MNKQYQKRYICCCIQQNYRKKERKRKKLPMYEGPEMTHFRGELNYRLPDMWSLTNGFPL